MATTFSNQIAVFWDFENCRPPSNFSGNKIIDKIRCLVQGPGGITTFRAYIDLSLECTSPRSIALHSDLQSSGLTLVHCPHNGKKDVADKMMIVDMLAFAIDRPPPASVVIITGDRDFAYAAAILKLRGYHIIVIAPPYNAHASLKVQADHLYDWQKDVLCGSDLEAIPSPLKPVGLTSQMNEASPATSTIPIFSQPKGLPDVPSSSPSLSRRNDITPALLNEPMAQAVTDYRRDTDPPLPSFLAQQYVSLRAVGGRPELQPPNESRPDSPLISKSSGLLTCVDELSFPRVNMEGIQPGQAAKPSQIGITTESHLVTLTDVESLGTSVTSVDSETSLSPSEMDVDSPTLSTVAPLACGPEYSSNDLMSSGGGLDCDTLSILDSPSVRVEIGSDDRSDPVERVLNLVESSTEQAGVPLCSPTDIQRPLTALLVETSPPTTTSAPEASPALEPSSGTKSNNLREASSTDTSSSTHNPPSLTPISSQRFQTLIAFFIDRKASGGTTRIRSAEVATEILKRDPEVYEKAGVTRLKPFIEEARKTGVIISPGFDKDGQAWVEINPWFYTVAYTSTATENLPPSVPPLKESSSPSGSSSNPAPVVKPIFNPLLDGLRAETPSHRLLYSKLGTFLRAQHPDVYKRASVKNLSAYLCNAEKQGVVRLGLTDTPGSEWVELMPVHRTPIRKG